MPLRVRLDQLTSGPLREDRKLAMDWCGERLGNHFQAKESAFQVAIEVRRAAQVVEAKCHIVGAFDLGCSRCGDTVTLRVDTVFTHRFVPSGGLDAGDSDESESLFTADPDVSEHDGREVDLAPLCVEYTILAIPYAPSCVDAPAGPCEKWSDEPAVFGDVPPEEDEEDLSPWAALKGLKLPSKNEQS